jgi:hypothetical protein
MRKNTCYSHQKKKKTCEATQYSSRVFREHGLGPVDRRALGRQQRLLTWRVDRKGKKRWSVESSQHSSNSIHGDRRLLRWQRIFARNSLTSSSGDRGWRCALSPANSMQFSSASEQNPGPGLWLCRLHAPAVENSLLSEHALHLHLHGWLMVQHTTVATSTWSMHAASSRCLWLAVVNSFYYTGRGAWECCSIGHKRFVWAVKTGFFLAGATPASNFKSVEIALCAGG